MSPKVSARRGLIMRRMILVFAIIALIPGMLMAYASLGIYHEGKLYYHPDAPFTVFPLHLYIVHTEHFVTAVEYQLQTPSDGEHLNFIVISVSYPPNQSISLGDPFGGHSIAFWPPCTGYPHGYDILATYTCMVLVPCDAMLEYPLVIGPHPDTGELRGTFTPDNEMFGIVGLTTILCGDAMPVDGDSWGSVKALFRE